MCTLSYLCSWGRIEKTFKAARISFAFLLHLVRCICKRDFGQRVFFLRGVLGQGKKLTPWVSICPWTGSENKMENWQTGVLQRLLLIFITMLFVKFFPQRPWSHQLVPIIWGSGAAISCFVSTYQVLPMSCFSSRPRCLEVGLKLLTFY